MAFECALARLGQRVDVVQSVDALLDVAGRDERVETPVELLGPDALVVVVLQTALEFLVSADAP